MTSALEAKLKYLLFTSWKRFVTSRRTFISSPFSEFNLKKERVQRLPYQQLQSFDSKVALVTGAGHGRFRHM